MVSIICTLQTYDITRSDFFRIYYHLRRFRICVIIIIIIISAIRNYEMFFFQ